MTTAGELSRRVTFQVRGADANGDLLGDWSTVVTRDAKIVPLKGGEGVQSQRLEGAQPVVIIVRRETLTKTIDNSYRAFDAREPAPPAEGCIVWGITSAIWNEAEDMMEFLAVQRRHGSDA